MVILNLISDFSIVQDKLFLGFGILTVVCVLLAMYVKYVVDLYNKIRKK